MKRITIPDCKSADLSTDERKNDGEGQLEEDVIKGDIGGDSHLWETKLYDIKWNNECLRSEEATLEL
jgi:hypothetical protein